jgi:F-type H+-transporting ATPase subunit a
MEVMQDVMDDVMGGGEEGCASGCITRTGCLGLIILIVVLAFLATKFPVALPEIALPAEPVFSIAGFAITNTLLATWLSMSILIVGSVLVTRRLKVVPTGVQNLVEWGLEVLLNLVEAVAGKRGRQFFPLIATIFVFLVVCNWMGILPGFGTVGLIHEAEHGGHKVESVSILGFDVHFLQAEEAGEHETGWTVVSFLRSAGTDLNTCLALALVSVAMTQVVGVGAQGLRYFSKFFNLRGPMGPIDMLVGLLELVSEFAKIVSFSFRLFGNLFAGEVLLAVMAFIIPYLVPVPFMGLEIFVGFMQAFVFAFLTLIFMYMATVGHGPEAEA